MKNESGEVQFSARRKVMRSCPHKGAIERAIEKIVAGA
jgi:hypothetical protein